MTSFSSDPSSKLRRLFRGLAAAREKKFTPLRPRVLNLAPLPLPGELPARVKVALLAVVSLAHRAFAESAVLAENSLLRRIHTPTENAHLLPQLEQLEREDQLLCSRFARLSP